MEGEKNQVHEQDPHRVPNLEPHTRLEPRDDLVVEAGGIEGQGQLFREVTHLQFHLGADFLGEERGGLKVTAEAGQGPAPGMGLLLHHDAPTHTEKQPRALSLSQDLATSFPIGKCLRGWEGAGSDHSDLPSPAFPHAWVEADAHSWPRKDARGWGAASSVWAVCSVKQWLFWEGESCVGPSHRTLTP